MKRKAINLKRGDFIRLGNREVVVLQDARPTTNPALCEVLAMYVSNGNTGYTSLGPDEEVALEVSRLTPDQLHADELAAQLNELVEYVRQHCTAYFTEDYLIASAKRGRALLDAITPPAPVPVDELLAALVDMPNQDEPMTAEDAKKVADILDRAYRSGQLKRRGDSHADDKA